MVYEPPWKEKLEELKNHGVMFLTVQDVAYMTNLSEATIKRLCTIGELDAFKCLGRWCIYIDSFIDYTIKNYSLNRN